MLPPVEPTALPLEVLELVAALDVPDVAAVLELLAVAEVALVPPDELPPVEEEVTPRVLASPLEPATVLVTLEPWPLVAAADEPVEPALLAPWVEALELDVEAALALLLVLLALPPPQPIAAPAMTTATMLAALTSTPPAPNALTMAGAALGDNRTRPPGFARP